MSIRNSAHRVVWAAWIGCMGAACGDDGLSDTAASETGNGDEDAGDSSPETAGEDVSSGGEVSSGGDVSSEGEASGGAVSGDVTTSADAGGETMSGEETSSPETSGSEDTGGSTVSAFAACAVCHGPNGEGMEGVGPDIQHPVHDYATWVIRNGRTAGEHEYYASASPMIAYPEGVLSEEDLAEIFEILDAPPKPTDGEGLYKDYCAHCHGNEGEGPAPMNRPIAGEEAGELIEHVHSGHHPGEFDNRGEFMPAWSESELSDAEIELVAEYLAGF